MKLRDLIENTDEVSLELLESLQERHLELIDLVEADLDGIRKAGYSADSINKKLGKVIKRLQAPVPPLKKEYGGLGDKVDSLNSQIADAIKAGNTKKAKELSRKANETYHKYQKMKSEDNLKSAKGSIEGQNKSKAELKAEVDRIRAEIKKLESQQDLAVKDYNKIDKDKAYERLAKKSEKNAKYATKMRISLKGKGASCIKEKSC